MSCTQRSLAEVLRGLRAEKGVGQLELALAMDGAAGYLSRLENGRSTNPGARFLARYAAAYAALGHPLTDGQRALLADVLLASTAESPEARHNACEGTTATRGT